MNFDIVEETQSRDVFSVANLIYNPEALENLQTLAEVLCSQTGMVPEHLRESKGDMMAVIMQAGRWGLDPLMVAQSTFCLNGIIGYEAKLMQAIVKANGGLWFSGEHYGAWEKIVGNTKTTKATKKGKYGDYEAEKTVAAWLPEDEMGVGYIITGHFPDGRTEELDVPLITCKPRHSTNWIYDPQQQIHYAAVKRFVRRFAPELAIGVRDYDDVMCSNKEKEINPPQKTTQKPKKKIKTKAIPFIKSDENDLSNPIIINESANDVDNGRYQKIHKRVMEITNEMEYKQAVMACKEAKDNLSIEQIETLRDLLKGKKLEFSDD